MDLPKYNLSNNARDLLKKIALNVSKRKITIISQVITKQAIISFQVIALTSSNITNCCNKYAKLNSPG